jgi:hypothetical protein
MIKSKSTKIILGCLYRAPSGNIHEFLDIEIPWIEFRLSHELEDTIDKKYKNLVKLVM